ncbi:MAG: hypothetical protein OHK0046_02250 [Anaerolineae bacterium]
MGILIEHGMKEPIIIVNWQNPFDTTTDILESNKLVSDFANRSGTPVYRIIDTHEIDLTFGDLVHILDLKTRNEPGSLRDPRIHTVLVGTHEMVRMKAQSLSQEQYGGLNVPLFESVDDAIAYCRAQLVMG